MIKSFNLFVLIILLVATIGCDSNNNNNPTALTENGFAEDSGAQTVQDNRITLINTSRCPLCNLRGANLSGLNLRRAVLSEADLSGSNLSGADLFRADLSEANLKGANLKGANLTKAHLSKTNLSGSILSGVDLSGAYLFKADLSGAKWCDGLCTCGTSDTCVGCVCDGKCISVDVCRGLGSQ